MQNSGRASVPSEHGRFRQAPIVLNHCSLLTQGPWRFVFPWPPSHGGRKAETGAPDLGRVCLHSPFTPLVLLELSPTGTGLNGWRHSVEPMVEKQVGGMSQTAGKTKQQAGTCKDYTLIMWKADTATGATAASQ
ncbi:hypothetical protein JOQ06_015500 [Pogonophryne albipinna]|uniref:Uncharacterized protein n=1 Tax=Pogonophryne albipinna TaxID=1090488 RepID=A0AAD6AN49_9TELE|nr:hypothetical protein JOQ06_015500 [Pogonophryne albipinna]